MSFTQTQLDEVNAGIAALGAGRQVVNVRSASGKSVSYSPADLDKLIRVRNMMQADLAAQASTARRSRTRNVVTSKGL